MAWFGCWGNVGNDGVGVVHCMGLVECEGVYARGGVEVHFGQADVNGSDLRSWFVLVSQWKMEV